MAIGKKNTVDGKLLIVRIVNKVKDSVTGQDVKIMPHQFQFFEKQNDKWVARTQLEGAFSGNLVRLDFEDDEFEGKPYKKVKALFNDPVEKESYLVDFRYTNLSRNIFNSLLALTTFENLGLSLYKKTSKKDNKEYANAALRQNDVMVKGKFALDAIPKPEVITSKAGVVLQRIFTEVDDFFFAELQALAKRVNSQGKSVPAAKVAVTAPTVDDTQDEDQFPI